MLTSGIVLIHVNACPHSARATQRLLQQFQWDIFEYPPHSPNLESSDFHHFLELKHWLGGQRFQTDMELKETITTHFQSLAATFYEEGIAKLVYRYDKCLNCQGDYVEKLLLVIKSFLKIDPSSSLPTGG